MITLTREEAQQVLDVIERNIVGVPRYKATELLRARLAQPEPEPVAWTVGGLITDFSRDFSAYKTKTYTRPLYTTPPQAEPEPVAWMYNAGTENRITFIDPHPIRQDAIPLYTVPPHREWQGLTNEEIMDACSAVWASHPIEVGRVVEEKLKEKNS